MPLPACKPGIPDGNQAGPVAVETACPLPGLKPFKTAPRKTGPPIMPANTGGCKPLIGRMFTAGRANLNGTAARAGVMPGRARGRPRKAPVGARRVVREAGTPSDRSVQPTNGRLYPSPRWGVQPTNGRLYPSPRWVVQPTNGRLYPPVGGYFFFGAIIITICRPSRRGRDSITMSSPRSPSIRLAISRPSS